MIQDFLDPIKPKDIPRELVFTLKEILRNYLLELDSNQSDFKQSKTFVDKQKNLDDLDQDEDDHQKIKLSLFKILKNQETAYLLGENEDDYPMDQPLQVAQEPGSSTSKVPGSGSPTKVLEINKKHSEPASASSVGRSRGLKKKLMFSKLNEINFQEKFRKKFQE